jgi:hypothetical protein
MSHEGVGGGKKVPKKCHVLFEWPRKLFISIRRQNVNIYDRGTEKNKTRIHDKPGFIRPFADLQIGAYSSNKKENPLNKEKTSNDPHHVATNTMFLKLIDTPDFLHSTKMFIICLLLYFFTPNIFSCEFELLAFDISGCVLDTREPFLRPE